MLLLNIVTVANLLLLFFVMYFRKNNALPNKILALILLNPAVNFLSNINILSGNFFDLPYIYFFAQATAFAFAPLVHIYTNLLIGRKITGGHPLYIVSVLAVFMVIYFAADFALMNSFQQIEYVNGITNEPYPTEMIITNIVYVLLQQIYLTILAINVYQYKRVLTADPGNSEKTKISYITKFISLIWVLNLLSIIAYSTLPTTKVEYLILPIAVTFVYFFILYFSFRHRSIFTQKSYQNFKKQFDNQ